MTVNLLLVIMTRLRSKNSGRIGNLLLKNQGARAWFFLCRKILCYTKFMKTFEEIYANHAEMPYISAKYEDELRRKPISKRNMERTREGLLPGHIILLWRINFGTYTTHSPQHKYFYTTYGIDAQKELDWLIEHDYLRLMSAQESLIYLRADELKDFLKIETVKGLSKMKRQDLEQKMLEVYSEDELAPLFALRGYALTAKGEEVLAAHPEIVRRHPQKKF